MTPRLSASFGVLLAGTLPLVAYSQVYMTEDQAAKQLLGDTATRKALELSPQEIQTIEKGSNEAVRNSTVVAWIDSKKNIAFMDQVLGKHEFITYAVGISKAGRVTGIEILEYRETYGSQVKEEPWKRQFYGKDSSPPSSSAKTLSISAARLSPRPMLRPGFDACFKPMKSSARASEHSLSRMRPALGTFVEIRLTGPHSEDQLQRKIARAFLQIKRVEELMSFHWIRAISLG